MSVENGDLARAGSIGLFGGTFNPIHVAHLILAEWAREALRLDAVLFMPASVPPHKIGQREIAPAEARHEMIRRAIASSPGFHVSRFEIDREGISYTVDTLRYLREIYPGAALTLLIGGDNAVDFHTWREPEEIVQLARVGVWARPSFTLPAGPLLGAEYHRLDGPLMEISSTMVRERVRSGRSIRHITPDAVASYIYDNGLYR